MTYQEQLAKVNATIAQKQKAMGEIMTKAVGENRTPNDDEEAQIAQIEGDIKALEKNAQRLESLIKATTKANTATDIAGDTPEQAAASATGEPVATVKSNLEQGVGFALLVKASAISTKYINKRKSNLIKVYQKPLKNIAFKVFLLYNLNQT